MGFVDDEFGEMRRAGMKIPFVASAACWRKTVDEPVSGLDERDDFGLLPGKGS